MTVIVRKNSKKAGEPVEAVQFLGDPSVHAGIFLDQSPRRHWRFGGESHGGAYDSSSSFLEIGDWIIGQGISAFVVNHVTFEKEWSVHQPLPDDIPIDTIRTAVDELISGIDSVRIRAEEGKDDDARAFLNDQGGWNILHMLFLASACAVVKGLGDDDLNVRIVATALARYGFKETQR